MIKFTYYGDAVGKGRPRYSKRGDYVHTYTPKKTKDFEDAVRFEFIASNCEPMPVYDREVALKADIRVGVAIPKSYPKKRQALCRDGVIAPSKKPDIDNILKSIFDALNGYAFCDDVQIVQVTAEKFYVENPFIEVKIDEFQRT